MSFAILRLWPRLFRCSDVCPDSEIWSQCYKHSYHSFTPILALFSYFCGFFSKIWLKWCKTVVRMFITLTPSRGDVPSSRERRIFRSLRPLKQKNDVILFIFNIFIYVSFYYLLLLFYYYYFTITILLLLFYYYYFTVTNVLLYFYTVCLFP